MQNEAGEYSDRYIPRKCSASNWLIGAKDHAAVQIDLAELNPKGQMTGNIKRYTVCGQIRRIGESDSSLVRLACRDGIVGE